MGKCNYCSKYFDDDHKVLKEYNFDAHGAFDWGVEVGIFRDSAVSGKLYFDIVMNGLNTTVAMVDINYCPMCGRKLKEDK